MVLLDTKMRILLSAFNNTVKIILLCNMHTITSTINSQKALKFQQTGNVK